MVVVDSLSPAGFGCRFSVRAILRARQYARDELQLDDRQPAGLSWHQQSGFPYPSHAL